MMNSTALGIVCSTLVCVLHSFIRLWRGKPLNIRLIFVLFGGVFVIPAGAEMIRAAYTGNFGDLPNSWPQYVGAAGVIAVGLPVEYLLKTLGEAWRPDDATGKAEEANRST
jgi:hypothetical protein